jgi:hypothetical protein
MAVTIKASINLDKITESKIFQGKKGRYLSLDIQVWDNSNQHDQNVSIKEAKNKDEIENQSPDNYLGNGKVVWNNGKIQNA